MGHIFSKTIAKCLTPLKSCLVKELYTVHSWGSSKCRPTDIKDKVPNFGDCGSVEWLFKVNDSNPIKGF